MTTESNDDSQPNNEPDVAPPVRSFIKPSGDLLQDANDLFKALMGREPTPEEIEESKEWLRKKGLPVQE